MIYLKWWKGRNYNQEYSTQQDSHSDVREKSKAFQTSKFKRIQHHETSFKMNAKGTSLGRKQEKEKTYRKKNTKTIKKMVIGSYISIITSVNGLNAPTKRHRLVGQMKTCACMDFQLSLTLLDHPSPNLNKNFFILLSYSRFHYDLQL